MSGLAHTAETGPVPEADDAAPLSNLVGLLVASGDLLWSRTPSAGPGSYPKP